VKVHSFTLMLPSWHATLQALCLGHEPKAKVVTMNYFQNIGIIKS
jgi:hypothetical protein